MLLRVVLTSRSERQAARGGRRSLGNFLQSSPTEIAFSLLIGSHRWRGGAVLHSGTPGNVANERRSQDDVFPSNYKTKATFHLGQTIASAHQAQRNRENIENVTNRCTFQM